MRERNHRKQSTFRDANIYSSQKGVRETREEIPYWWQVTTQSASDWLKRIFHAAPTTNKKHGPDLGRDTSSVVPETSFRGETSDGVVKCRLFFQASAREASPFIEKIPLLNWYGDTNSVFSLTWPASMQIYWNKRKRLHKKRVQLPQDWFGTQTWPPFHCFGT